MYINDDKNTNLWENVRTVIISFANEKFVVEYTEEEIGNKSPFVAAVHSYLGNKILMENYH